MADGKDLYAALGVDKSTTDDAIRKAYRKLARKWHPDVNPGNKEAEDKFKEISAAYDVLSDPAKRKLYDEFGHEGIREGFDPEAARSYRRWSEGRRTTGAASEDIPYEINLEDILGGFGGMGGGFGRRATRPAAGEDLRAVVELDFMDALRGTEIEVGLPVAKACPTCNGSGDQPGTKPETCPECGGTGKKQAVRGPMKIMTTCPRCGGAGVVRTPCTTCDGEGTITTEQSVKIRIPPGADDGSELRVRGKGRPGRDGGPTGDLVLGIRVRPHPILRRDGLDLSLPLPVTLDEAYNGSSIEVPTPDGPVKMKVPPRSQSGTRLRLRGKGVVRGDHRGDLFVQLEVRLPDREDAQLADALRAANQLYGKPVREGLTL